MDNSKDPFARFMCLGYELKPVLQGCMQEQDGSGAQWPSARWRWRHCRLLGADKHCLAPEHMHAFNEDDEVDLHMHICVHWLPPQLLVQMPASCRAAAPAPRPTGALPPFERHGSSSEQLGHASEGSIRLADKPVQQAR